MTENHNQSTSALRLHQCRLEQRLQKRLALPLSSSLLLTCSHRSSESPTSCCRRHHIYSSLSSHSFNSRSYVASNHTHTHAHARAPWLLSINDLPLTLWRAEDEGRGRDGGRQTSWGSAGRRGKSWYVWSTRPSSVCTPKGCCWSATYRPVCLGLCPSPQSNPTGVAASLESTAGTEVSSTERHRLPPSVVSAGQEDCVGALLPSATCCPSW